MISKCNRLGIAFNDKNICSTYSKYTFVSMFVLWIGISFIFCHLYPSPFLHNLSPKYFCPTGDENKTKLQQITREASLRFWYPLGLVVTQVNHPISLLLYLCTLRLQVSTRFPALAWNQLCGLIECNVHLQKRQDMIICSDFHSTKSTSFAVQYLL